MLNVQNLSYGYTQDAALFQDLSLCLNPGEALVIHGSNGVGKTTLLNLFVGLLKPRQGEILWRNQSILDHSASFTSEVGFIGHHLALKLDLTVKDMLYYFQSMDGVASNLEVLKLFNLFAYQNYPIKHLSFGQKRRLLLSRMMDSKKLLWILDEPLAGLDKDGIACFENLLAKHLESGGLMILTSHQALKLKCHKVYQLEL